MVNILVLSIAIILFLVATSLVFRFKSKFSKKYLITYVILFTVLIGSEFIKLDKIPYIFGDEAFCMYDSWCIGNYGVDGHLVRHAIYSLSSGGQSILYENLTAPLMKIFGMNITAFRLPLVTLSCITVIFLFYVLIKLNLNKNYLLGFLTVWTLSPFFIMETRWAQDCNIVFLLMLLGIGFFVLACQTNKQYLFFVSIICFGLMSYSYMASWILLPFLVIGLFGIAIFNKKLNYKYFLMSLLLVIFMELPLIAYIGRQFLHLHINHFMGFTMITLPKTRAGISLINLANGHVLHLMFANIIGGFTMLSTNNDHLSYLTIPGFGQLYPFSLLLAFVGLMFILSCFKQQRTWLIEVILVLLLSIIPYMLVVKPDFTHWIFVVAIMQIFVGLGVGYLFDIDKNKLIKKSIVLLYGILFALFLGNYFTSFVKNENCYLGNLAYVMNKNDIYKFTRIINKYHAKRVYGLPFSSIFVLLADKTIPKDASTIINNYYGNYPDKIVPNSIYIFKDGVYLKGLNTNSLKDDHNTVEFNGYKYLIDYKK